MVDQTYRARVCELVSVDTTELILRRDAAVIPVSKLNTYVRKNLLGAYLAVNSWLNIVRDYCGDNYLDLLQALKHYGLYTVVQRFADAADSLVTGQAIVDDLVSHILDSVVERQDCVKVTSAGYRPTLLSIRLQICRFLKRMTLQERPELDRAAKDKFHALQLALMDTEPVRCGFYPALDGLQWPPLSSYEPVAALIRDSIDWPAIYAELDAMDATSRTFTSGAAADAGTPFSAKIQWLARSDPGFFHPIMGSWLEAPSQEVDPEWVDADYRARVGVPDWVNHRHTVRISTAPKSMKTPRIIAMEPTNFQMAERFIKDILYRHFPSDIDLRDQERNRALAFEGSVDCSYATLDLSSASDYVTKNLVCRIFPEEFLKRVWWTVPSHYQIGNAVYPLASFATMGNGLTFWVESVTFWAISRTATDYACVYGDDIIVPGKDALAVIQALKKFGFVVNESKSFWEGHYRESCGAEFWNGIPCHTQYFPRFAVKGTVTDHLASFSESTWCEDGVYFDATKKAVELQHRLTNVSLNAARFVADVVRSAHPQMTTSIYGSDSPDLWGPFEIASKGRPAPTGSIVSETGPDGVAQNTLGDAPVSARQLAESFCRETWYGDSVVVSDDDRVDGPLVEHALYARFLKMGPREWRESDGWLPDNATLPLREEFVRPKMVVVWGITSK